VVVWGSGDPVVLAHSAVVIPEQILLERLRARLGTGLGATERGESTPEDWAIFTGAGAWSEGKESIAGQKSEPMRFGSRMAAVRNVELSGDARADACWVEAVEDGWLFLLPTEHGKGSLISVGGDVGRLLANSRLGEQVRSIEGEAVAEFAAYPRIMSRLCGDRWLACGSAAIAFDPLCGEGVGNAAREAILACAAVKAILGGESREDVLAEYQMRLLLGFLRHLENCREFYTRVAASEFWQGELRAIEQGIAWTKGGFTGGDGPRFRLVGFELERMAR
jgi:flavin-dependent dehydrogenase